MRSSVLTFRRHACRGAVLLGAALLLAGCYHPSEDNIRLRKVNQGLQNQVSTLTTKTEAQQSMIDGLMKRANSVTTLPPDEFKKLWIASGLKLGKLTGGSDLDTGSPGVQGLHVFANPTDDNGQAVQAAGSFVVDAFDLADKTNPHVGHWTWDAATAKASWRTFLFEFGYELKCPWQTVPQHPDITVRVTFTDELTQIPYDAQAVVHVDLSAAPTTAPTTAAAK